MRGRSVEHSPRVPGDFDVVRVERRGLLLRSPAIKCRRTSRAAVGRHDRFPDCGRPQLACTGYSDVTQHSTSVQHQHPLGIDARLLQQFFRPHRIPRDAFTRTVHLSRSLTTVAASKKTRFFVPFQRPFQIVRPAGFGCVKIR